MPGSIKNQLRNYRHVTPKTIVHSPYPPPPPWKYGKSVQEPKPEDMSPNATDDERKTIQKKVGSILYYRHAIKIPTLMLLSTIASHQ